MQKRAEELYVEPYLRYQRFIESCRIKKYSSNEVLHKHHIIPTFIYTDTSYRKKVISLSIPDHIEAHLLLSKCFHEDSYESIGNLMAVKLLSKNSEEYRFNFDRMYSHMMGDNNVAKKPEVRDKIKEGLLKYYTINDNACKGKSYEEIYGDCSETQREKRRKTTRTPEQYKEASIKISKSKKGQVSHNAKEVIIDGVKYRSLKQASEILKISKYKLKKEWLKY